MARSRSTLTPFPFKTLEHINIFIYTYITIFTQNTTKSLRNEPNVQNKLKKSHIELFLFTFSKLISDTTSNIHILLPQYLISLQRHKKIDGNFFRQGERGKKL